MLVITVGILALFGLIPILAATTAELTHTPLQGLILTNAHVVPGQETKGPYIFQAAWFSIRHAEREGLDTLSGLNYDSFHNLVNSDANPLSQESLSTSTVSWLYQYLTAPNAQLTVGLDDEDPIKIARDSSLPNQPWEKNDIGTPYYFIDYEQQNGKLIDIMPIPTTVEGYETEQVHYGDSRLSSSYFSSVGYTNYPTYSVIRSFTHTTQSDRRLQPYKLYFKMKAVGGVGSHLYYKITVQPENEEEIVVKTGNVYRGNSNDYGTATVTYDCPQGDAGQKMIIRFYAVTTGWPTYNVKDFTSYCKVSSAYYDNSGYQNVDSVEFSEYGDTVLNSADQLIATHSHISNSYEYFKPYKISMNIRNRQENSVQDMGYKVTMQVDGGDETTIQTGSFYMNWYKDFQKIDLDLNAPVLDPGQNVVLRVYLSPNYYARVDGIYSYCYSYMEGYDSPGEYSPDTYFKYSHGGYNIPFVVNTLNSYYRFAFPYLVRNEQMINVVERIEEAGGIYDSLAYFTPEPYVYQYHEAVFANVYHTKTSLIQPLNDALAEDISNQLHIIYSDNPAYDKIEYDVDLVMKASNWEATYQITEDRCVAYPNVDGTKECKTLNGVTTCYCYYDPNPGYRRITSASIYGSCTLDLDQVSVTVREKNGETVATTEELITPVLDDITKTDDIRIANEYDFYITYGPTDSVYYQQYTPRGINTGCEFNLVSALSCDEILYPGWYQEIEVNTNRLDGSDTAYVSSKVTRQL